MCGTALGILRQQDLLSRDKDVDVAMFTDQLEKIQKEEVVVGDAFAVEVMDASWGNQDRNQKRDYIIPMRLFDRDNGLYVDVFVLDRTSKPGRVLSMSKDTAALNYHDVPADMIFPIETCTTRSNITTKCAADLEGLVEYQFGPTWRIPQYFG